MFIANDCNGNRIDIDIDDAITGNTYYCPLCNGKLLIKRGTQKAHHFAHIQNDMYCDNDNDMSEWHRKMQMLFPIQNREIILMDNNGKCHIADVSIGNVVIEFQYSPISEEEFWERNAFYLNLNKMLIWVFDLNKCQIKALDYDRTSRNGILYNEYMGWDEYDDNYLNYLEDLKKVNIDEDAIYYKWNYSNKNLRYLNPSIFFPNILIFFDMNQSNKISRVNWAIPKKALEKRENVITARKTISVSYKYFSIQKKLIFPYSKFANFIHMIKYSNKDVQVPFKPHTKRNVNKHINFNER